MHQRFSREGVPIDLIAEYNRGTKYVMSGNFKKALPILKYCLSQMEFKEGYINIGNCYRAIGMQTKAFESYKRAADSDVPSLDNKHESLNHALNNLGLAYYTIGDDETAIKTYKKAITSNPQFWDGWWNCSTAHLRKACSGHPEMFPVGWEMYRARFLKSTPVAIKNRKEGLLYWDTLNGGNSIIALTEQGIGDSIMWGRYLAELQKKFTKVYVQCDEALEPLFAGYNPVRDAADCDAEVAYPICSLAEAFNGGAPTPGNWLEGKFATRQFDNSRYNIGIAWQGSTTHANDHNRSVGIGRFNRLAKLANLYSLSPGFKSTDKVKSLDNKTWTDTAEAINGLDLVISVDTSVVHLAGSLGKETWMLQPLQETDFRWGNNVAKCPWYDSVEVFSNPKSWEFVFDQVEERLKERLYVR